MNELNTRGEFEARLQMTTKGAEGGVVARGLNDANMRWLAIGAFVVLSGFGFNQWASGIVRIIQAIIEN